MTSYLARSIYEVVGPKFVHFVKIGSRGRGHRVFQKIKKNLKKSSSPKPLGTLT